MEKKDFIKVGGGVANEKNLVPNEKRTPSERRENSRKAGKASGEARRRRKAIRENMEFLLNLPPSNAKDFNKLTKAGFPVEEMDNSQLIVLGLFNRAKTGDVYAIKELLCLVGEDKREAEQIKLLKAQQEELKRKKGESASNQDKTLTFTIKPAAEKPESEVEDE